MTVISNYNNSVMSKKYLKGGVLTAFHREYNSCSSHKLFLESLNELKIVFHRNSYPKKLIESKLKLFLDDREKPTRLPSNHTITLDYTSPDIEKYIQRLTT